MVKKVKFLDKRVREKFLGIIGAISTIATTIFIFVGIPENWNSIYLLVILSILLFILYFCIWRHANRLTEAKVKIGETTIVIKKGDIFGEKELKVIPFNEYFDTIVDDKVINRKSLNGEYINNVFKDVDELNRLIREDQDLNTKLNKLDENVIRRGGRGNTTKYKLGSMIVIDDYILTAFSRFDEENKANLSMVDYVNFLLTFWNEINRVYAQKSVSVPLFGGGITRFQGRFSDINENELLMTMLWTFKLSETRFRYPAKLTIVLYKDLFDKIDLFNLREDIQ